jgi:hypothetical protein
MQTRSLRRLVPAVAAAACLTVLTAGCGNDTHVGDPGGAATVDEAPPSPGATPTGSPPSPTAATTTPTGSPGSTGSTGSTAPPTGSGAPLASGSVASRVAYFSTSVRAADGLHTVLHDGGELQRYAQRFAAGDPKAARDIVAGGGRTDFTRSVLVGWTRTTGCSVATAAALGVSGDRLVLRVSAPKPPPECFAADQVTVVFEVPKERMPARPVFG